ncbi:twin transmembrane helix small protein [Pseudoxanthomonas sp. SE1]|jgi:succinate dehydrogenase/fumarate reductase cytochrome b subunit|uniref:twin transmembrane helix small protein n=1 Tax=Pseudoxanthomonas sp. SE1 TaxID=1664560 RepID=UPI00240DDBA7|nr:twin transmembrane helix small protein [Pseudoxanthomonas sp. SE1]WFC41737.1 twin transmembrane helix small protein [Pseudoxanthomonas sp. SE1]
MKTLVIIGFFVLILYNLGAGMYYMLTDKGNSKRTVHALTRRVAFSVLLILLVCIGIATGIIEPHGIPA